MGGEILALNRAMVLLEFLVVFSEDKEPNFEQLIGTFQSEEGTRLRLYCMTTATETESNKKIILKNKGGRYRRSAE